MPSGRRPLAIGAPFAAALAACGLGIVGEADLAGTATDGGSVVDVRPRPPGEDAVTPSPVDAGADAAPERPCSRARAVTGVRLCVDFDDVPPLPPPFGFGRAEIAPPGEGTIAYAPSPLGPDSGQGLAFTLPQSTIGERTVRVVHDLGEVQPLASLRVLADVDVTLGEITTGPALFALEVLGSACAVRPGVLATPSGLSYIEGGGTTAPLPTGPFHIAIDATIAPGLPGRAVVVAAGTTLFDGDVSYGSGCTGVDLVLGTFFTGTPGRASAVFDDVLVRTPE